MDYKKIAKFYSKANSENKFDKSFILDAKNISTEDDLKKFLEKKLLPIAKDMGYDFSVDELIAYEKHIATEKQEPQLLSEDELENVIGGVNVKAWALGGALSLTAILGTGIALNANTANAIEATPITESSYTQTVQINNNSSTTDAGNVTLGNVNATALKDIKEATTQAKTSAEENSTATTETKESSDTQTQKSTNTQEDATKETVKQTTKTSIAKAEQVSTSDWMSKVNDNTCLKDLNIPGTHDSGTASTRNRNTSFLVNENFSASCQDDSIAAQLYKGIRFLDLRVDGNDLNICHGSNDGFSKVIGTNCYKDTFHKLYLKDVFDDINSFLDHHPNETLIIKIKDERDRGTTFINAMNAFLKGQTKIYTGGGDLASLHLKDVRGKIIILADNLDNATGFDDWSCTKTSFNTTLGTSKVVLQDKYKDTNATDKMNDIKDFYKQVWNDSNCDDSFRICFTSCEGHSTANKTLDTINTAINTGIRTLAKGFNKFCKWFGAKKDVITVKETYVTIGKNVPNIPDPKDVAKDINKELLQFVNENHDKTFGIVPMDNPDSGLINSIIELNFNRT